MGKIHVHYLDEGSFMHITLPTIDYYNRKEEWEEIKIGENIFLHINKYDKALEAIGIAGISREECDIIRLFIEMGVFNFDWQDGVAIQKLKDLGFLNAVEDLTGREEDELTHDYDYQRNVS